MRGAKARGEREERERSHFCLTLHSSSSKHQPPLAGRSPGSPDSQHRHTDSSLPLTSGRHNVSGLYRHTLCITLGDHSHKFYFQLLSKIVIFIVYYLFEHAANTQEDDVSININMKLDVIK